MVTESLLVFTFSTADGSEVLNVSRGRVHVEGVARLLRSQQGETVGAIEVGTQVDNFVERPSLGPTRPSIAT